VGIHARPAAQVAGELVNWPGVTMTLGRIGEPAVDIRNVLAVIGLGVRNGEQVRVSGAGPAAAAAVDRIVELLEAVVPTAR
jgi:phosphocarrier protein